MKVVITRPFICKSKVVEEQAGFIHQRKRWISPRHPSFQRPFLGPKGCISLEVQGYPHGNQLQTCALESVQLWFQKSPVGMEWPFSENAKGHGQERSHLNPWPAWPSEAGFFGRATWGLRDKILCVSFPSRTPCRRAHQLQLHPGQRPFCSRREQPKSVRNVSWDFTSSQPTLREVPAFN